jgi:hypothetical protein
LQLEFKLALDVYQPGAFSQLLLVLVLEAMVSLLLLALFKLVEELC